MPSASTIATAATNKTKHSTSSALVRLFVAIRCVSRRASFSSTNQPASASRRSRPSGLRTTVQQERVGLHSSTNVPGPVPLSFVWFSL